MRSAALCLLAICWLFRSQMLFVVWDALFGVCVTALPLSASIISFFYPDVRIKNSDPYSPGSPPPKLLNARIGRLQSQQAMANME